LSPGILSADAEGSDTGIIPEAELQSLKSGLTDEQYAQEFECSFEAAVIGAYFGKLMAAAEADKPSRITGVPFEPTAQVYTAWDLGIRDSTAIWFAQVIGREIRIIDYYESSGVDLGHYVRELGQRSQFVYAGHIVPHDAQAKELGTGKSAWKFWKALG
jgi:phage terminase large subunit